MKCKIVLCLVIITNLISSVLCAPFLSSMKAADKLTFLDEHGYEVISDAEEILTPVSPAKENSASQGVTTKPDMLLYGRFYVLRQRGLLSSGKTNLIESDTFPKSYPASTGQRYFQYRSSLGPQKSPATNVPTSTPSTPTAVDSNVERQKEHSGDSILFPTEESTTPKKQYIRRIHHAGTIIAPSVFENVPRYGKHENKRTTPKKFSTSTSTSTTPQPQTTPNNKEIKNNFENMNSEEFVSWAKDNLNVGEIQHLVKETLAEAEEKEGETTLSPDYDGIQYNSFILIPTLKCPEGERLNHRGICTPKYIHNAAPHEVVLLKNRANRGSTKMKLMELLKTLKSMEADVETALAKETKAEPSFSTSPKLT